MSKIPEALWNIRAAMLLFVIDVNILGFDVVPDFVGWLCLLGAIDHLEGTVPSIERIRTFGRVLFWYEILAIVLNYVGGELPFLPAVLPIASIFLFCIRIYFMYIILTAVADAAALEGGEADTVKKLCRSRNWVLIAELLINVSAAIKGETVISGVIWVPTVLYFIFYIGCILRLTFLKEEVEAFRKAKEEPQEG